MYFVLVLVYVYNILGIMLHELLYGSLMGLIND